MQVQVLAQIQQQQMQMQVWGPSSSTQHPAAPPSDEVEVDVPTEVSIATWALAWEHPTERKQTPESRFRTNGPMPQYKKKDWTYDLTAFLDWLPMHSQVKKQCSKNSTAGNLERFFRLLEIPEGAHCPDLEMGRDAGNPASVFYVGVQPHSSGWYQLP